MNRHLTVALRVLFTLCTLGTVLFIFSNSSEAGQLSGVRSAQVTALLNRGVAALGFGFTLSEALVRKLGHVAEYMLLGFFLMLTLRVYTKRILAHLHVPLFWGLSTAVCDEFYQTFIPGRAGQVRDVVIDFGGILLGTLCALFVMLVIREALRWRKAPS